MLRKVGTLVKARGVQAPGILLSEWPYAGTGGLGDRVAISRVLFQSGSVAFSAQIF